MKYKFIFLFLLFSFVSYAYDRHKPKDTLAIYQHIDTNYIENYHDWLNLRMVGVVRDNKFAMTDNTSKGRLEYGINTNVNLGLGFSFKNIGFEFQYNPPGVNNDDYKYGKSKQIAFSTSANGRKIIYDVYYRYNQGYHTSSNYKIPNDTGFTYAPLYRPDIKNTTAGCDFTYVFNNKRFSISAPYDLTQRQKKSAGSLIAGSFFSVYAVDADSSVVPDSLSKFFNKEVQFKSASSLTWGLSCGYTYTFIFARNWFVNLYTLPGISVQQFHSVSAYTQQTHTSVALGFAFQTRLSMGYNRRNYFIGISLVGDNFFIDDDKKSSLRYSFSGFRFYYGHRFNLRPLLKKHF
ncbi:MAG: hypothetical protein A3F72_17280 [Bacteroidetes bacterium RIFCSPLOWO2_12_FULL_35_15]|nr:MAG: hypothetical protein A3F72_17280 [Bacteroidetes bacterium RIFCSPLOWO2_12_FULL_35_15]